MARCDVDGMAFWGVGGVPQICGVLRMWHPGTFMWSCGLSLHILAFQVNC